MSDRLAALLLPVFSLRRTGGLGVGDTRSVCEWIDLAADHGVGLFQMLPINEMGSDDSPYNAISSVALEPVYLAMEEVPGVTEEGVRSARVASAQDEVELVDYPRVRALKHSLLEAAWGKWSQVDPALAR
ncbi:MAG: 4-alpha-glucanotransferase, partial [Verrucomicrobiales bacterium]